jgi:hypothetical protein
LRVEQPIVDEANSSTHSDTLLIPNIRRIKSKQTLHIKELKKIKAKGSLLIPEKRKIKEKKANWIILNFAG